MARISEGTLFHIVIFLFSSAKCDVERTLVAKLLEYEKETTDNSYILQKLYELHLELFRRNSPKVMEEKSSENREYDEHDCSSTSKFFSYKNQE